MVKKPIFLHIRKKVRFFLVLNTFLLFRTLHLRNQKFIGMHKLMYFQFNQCQQFVKSWIV